MTPDNGTSPTSAEPDPRHHLGRFAQNVAMTLWPSFLAASVATMAFFAFLDPLLFGEATGAPAWLEDRMAGYAAGFFFFWAVCTLSSAMTLYLLHTARSGAAGQRR